MVEYKRVSIKLSNQQIKKIKETVKGNNGTTLKIGNKNMSIDIKLSKAQIKKLLKEGGALGSMLARLLPKLIKPTISLGKNILAPLGLSAAMQ